MALRLGWECLRYPVEGGRAVRLLRAYRRAQEELRGAPAMDLEDAQLRLACRKTGLSADDARRYLRTWFEEAPLPFVARAVRPGVREFLAKAQAAGWRLGVFSDYPPLRKLEAMGMTGCFRSVRWAQQPDVGEFKPSPKGIWIALEELGAKAGEAIYVGDRAGVDGEAARRAGMRAMVVGAPRGASGPGWTGVGDFCELGRLLGLGLHAGRAGSKLRSRGAMP